jgi:hypothetical protein
VFTIIHTNPEGITMKKAQATRTNGANKIPFGQKVGRTVTAATMGAGYGFGRFAYRASKNFVAGVVEKASEVKAGYDEAKAEAEQK